MVEYRIEEKIPTDLISTENGYCLEYPGIRGEKRRGAPGLLGLSLLVFDGGRYSLVCGREAVQRCIDEQIRLRYGVVVDTIEDRCALLYLLIRIKSQLWGFNIVEKAVAISKLHSLAATVSGDLLKLFGIPQNERWINGYISLAGAPDEVKELLLLGRIDLLTAFELFGLEKHSWCRVARLIADIGLGTKKRNQLLSMIREIVERDKVTIEQIIESSEIDEILKMEIDAPHRGQKIYESIERIRYPYITEYKERFYEAVRRVGIDPGFHLTVPHDFEQWSFRMSFSFTSVEDFKGKLELLKKVGSNSAFQKLMALRY
jgi:hypothetical protein